MKIREAIIVAITSLLLTACIIGIPPPDGYTPPKPKPCDKRVTVYPEDITVCMTNEEFQRWLARARI